MSSPCLNRWGMNTFWHNFWFNDFEYAINLRQDKAFETLVNTFIFYGVTLSKNIFANLYWYAHFFKNLNFKNYHRWQSFTASYKNAVTEYYTVRREADCLFPMKIWIFKYAHWVIINQYWFNPFKGRRVKRRVIDNPTHMDSILMIKDRPRLDHIRRLKSAFFINQLKYLSYGKYYRF